MGRFEYNCPHCNSEMTGSFGENVYCEKCDLTFETEWDYISEGSMGAWLINRIGIEGKINIKNNE